MNNIMILTDEYFGIKPLPLNNPRIRYGARGIVLNDEKNVAVFYKENKLEYKLPGGGIEQGENPELAFKREVQEETGCEVEIIKQLGLFEEHRNTDNFKQISYVYVAKVINDTKELNLTQKEIDEGAKLLWVDEDKALKLISSSFNNVIASKYDNVYNINFIVIRDREIMKYYLANK